MVLILIIDAVVVAVLFYIALNKGVEEALPFFVFACVLLPTTARLNAGLFQLSPQRVALITLLVLTFLLGGRSGGERQGAGVPLKWLMAVQVVWALISTANSIVPVMSIKKLFSEVVEYYLLYLILARTVTSVRTIYRILYSMVAALLVCSIFGVLRAYAGWNVMSLFPEPGVSRIDEALGIGGGEGGRIASTFPHAILFGAALALGLTIPLHLAKRADSQAKRMFIWVAIVLMFWNIYKSFSRGPWLGLILAFIILLVFERTRVRKYIATTALLAVLVMVVRPGVYTSIKNLYGATIVTSNFNDVKGMSFEYRFELRRVAQAALAKSFSRELWGYGMESFFYLNLQGELAGHAFPFLSCDSTWIEFMVETGYVGLFLMAILLLKPAWMAWKDFRRLGDTDRYLSLTFFTCLVAYYFMMLSVDMYAWGQDGYMLWVLVALSVAYRNLEGARVQPEGRDATECETAPLAATAPCLRHGLLD